MRRHDTDTFPVVLFLSNMEFFLPVIHDCRRHDDKCSVLPKNTAKWVRTVEPHCVVFGKVSSFHLLAALMT